MPDSGTGSRRRVVIVGGGFGGLAAARRLRRADVDVTVIDRMNHHLFQPLLYQVAVGAVSTGECAAPIRVALRHGRRTNVLMDEVVDVDVEAREVVLDRGERIGYDSLIVACGAETSYFGKDEWEDVTCGLKTLADAVDLRNRIFGAFEQAERATDPEARKEWLTFAVIGGGPTGVEIAGALAVAAKDSRKGDYARIDPEDSQVILLDAGERVLSPFSESLSAKAAKGLAELGVTVREGVRATAIDSRGVTIDVGRLERADRQPDGHLGGWRAHRRPDRGARQGHRRGDRPRRAHQGAAGPDRARPPGDLGDRGHRQPRGSGRAAAARAWRRSRSSRRPTWPRGSGTDSRVPPSPSSISTRALSRYRKGPGDLRDQGPEVLRPLRARHLPRSAPLLPRWRGQAPQAPHRLDHHADRRPWKPGDPG